MCLEFNSKCDVVDVLVPHLDCFEKVRAHIFCSPRCLKEKSYRLCHVAGVAQLFTSDAVAFALKKLPCLKQVLQARVLLMEHATRKMNRKKNVYE